MLTERATSNEQKNSAVSIIPATSGIMDRIIQLLGGFNNQSIPAESWKAFLNYQWRDPELPYGFALCDQKEVVGFIATIFSPPLFSDKNRLCNISSWILHENYRARGLGFLLIKELIRIPHCTFTNFSPAPATIPGLKKLGFIELENSLTILTPLHVLTSIIENRNVKISSGSFITKLDPTQVKIYSDHLGLPCEHFLIESRNGNCYGMYRISSVGKYSISTIYYISNPDIFVSAAGNVAAWMCRHHHTPKTLIPSRFLQGSKIPFAIQRSGPAKGLYLPNGIPIEKIHGFYSELVMLN